MPNIASAKKRVRQTARRTEVNRARVSRIRTFIKKVEVVIGTGDVWVKGKKETIMTHKVELAFALTFDKSHNRSAEGPRLPRGTRQRPQPSCQREPRSTR